MLDPEKEVEFLLRIHCCIPPSKKIFDNPGLAEYHQNVVGAFSQWPDFEGKPPLDNWKEIILNCRGIETSWEHQSSRPELQESLLQAISSIEASRSSDNS